LKNIIKSKFFKDTTIYTISDILNKMVPFVLLPVLTRYLTPQDYGIIAMFFVFTSILGIVMTLETNTAIGVNYFKISREKLKVYIFNILLIIAVATSLTFAIIILFHTTISELLAIPVEWLFIGVVVTLLQFITTINLLLWQSEQNPIPLGIYQISQTILNLSLSLLLIIGFEMGWEGRLIAVSIASITFGISSLMFLYRRNYLKFEFSKEAIDDALKFGIPLLPHALSVWIRTGVDRIFITTFVSASATGLYTVAFQIASVITILTTAFNKAYSPYLFQKLTDITQNDKTKLVKYTYLYFIALLIIAGGLTLVSPILIEIFLGKSFQDVWRYIPWIAFGFAFYGMYLMVVNYILFTKKTASLSYVTMSVSLLHIVVSYILISYNGILGASQATTATSFILFVAVWWLSQKLYPMPWFDRLNIKGTKKVRKKILLINTIQFGYHTNSYKYCKYLKNEFDITYICFDTGKKKIEESGINICYVPYQGSILTRGIKFIKYCRNYIKTNQIDLIFVLYFKLSSLVKIGLPSHKFILDIRTGAVGSTPIKRAISDAIMRFESHFFNHITVISESLRDKLGLNSKKCHILPLGADKLSSKNKSFKSINLIYVGTLSFRDIDKTVLGLSKFIQKYQNKNIEISYDIFGSGTVEAEKLLRDSISSTNLENIVTFHGQKNHKEIQHYFDNCNVGVAYIPMVDYYDVQPSTKIFEYARAGMVNIATSTYENRRLITEDNGVLCDDSIDSFCDAVERVYLRRDKWNSKQIRKSLEDYSWENIIHNNLKKYFNEVLEKS